MRGKALSSAQVKALLGAAETARINAHCPYSKFSVGAALLTQSGEVFLGANIENASFGATLCAERSAMATAISAGERDFAAIAVVASSKTAPIPCGICLQVLAEFCPPSLPLILAPSPSLKPVKRLHLKDLLPKTFKFRP